MEEINYIGKFNLGGLLFDYDREKHMFNALNFPELRVSLWDFERDGTYFHRYLDTAEKRFVNFEDTINAADRDRYIRISIPQRMLEEDLEGKYAEIRGLNTVCYNGFCNVAMIEDQLNAALNDIRPQHLIRGEYYHYDSDNRTFNSLETPGRRMQLPGMTDLEGRGMEVYHLSMHGVCSPVDIHSDQFTTGDLLLKPVEMEPFRYLYHPKEYLPGEMLRSSPMDLTVVLLPVEHIQKLAERITGPQIWNCKGDFGGENEDFKVLGIEGNRFATDESMLPKWLSDSSHKAQAIFFGTLYHADFDNEKWISNRNPNETIAFGDFYTDSGGMASLAVDYWGKQRWGDQQEMHEFLIGSTLRIPYELMKAQTWDDQSKLKEINKTYAGYDFYAVDDILRRRVLENRLSAITMEGDVWRIDGKAGILISTTIAHQIIAFDQLGEGNNREGICLYDRKQKWDVDRAAHSMTEINDNWSVIRVPPLQILDPVGYAQKKGYGILQAISKSGITTMHQAKTIAMEESELWANVQETRKLSGLPPLEIPKYENENKKPKVNKGRKL